MIPRLHLSSLSPRVALNAAPLRGLFRLMRGSAAAQLVLLGTMPIVGRLYQPEDFSALGLFTAFLGVALVVSTLKFESAIVSADSDREADLLLLGSVAVSLPLSLSAACLLHGLRRADVLGFGELPAWGVWLLAPTLTLASCVAASRQWLVRNKRYKTLSNSFITRALGRSSALIGFGVAGGAPVGLIAGETVDRIIGCWVCYTRVWPSLTTKLTWRHLLGVLHTYRRFPMHCVPSRVIDAVATALPAPLLIACYGVDVGGSFVLAQQVLRGPAALFVKNASDVFHQQMAERVKQGDDPRRLIVRTTAGLLGFGLGPTLLFMAASPWAFPWCLGEGWARSGVFASILAPSLLAQFAVAPTSQTMSVFRAYHTKLSYDLANLIATATSITGCWWLGGSAMAAVVAVSASRILTYCYFHWLLKSVASPGSRRSSSRRPAQLAPLRSGGQQ